MHWMKRTGKDGRSLPPSWGTKYSLSVMTFCYQYRASGKGNQPWLRKLHSDQVKPDRFRFRNFRGSQDGTQSWIHSHFFSPFRRDRRYHNRRSGCRIKYLSDQDRCTEQEQSVWQKYNQLLRIEEELGAAAVYPGMGAFNVQK